MYYILRLFSHHSFSSTLKCWKNFLLQLQNNCNNYCIHKINKKIGINSFPFHIVCDWLQFIACWLLCMCIYDKTRVSKLRSKDLRAMLTLLRNWADITHPDFSKIYFQGMSLSSWLCTGKPTTSLESLDLKLLYF